MTSIAPISRIKVLDVAYISGKLGWGWQWPVMEIRAVHRCIFLSDLTRTDPFKPNDRKSNVKKLR
jgi:hypothetical protein